MRPNLRIDTCGGFIFNNEDPDDKEHYWQGFFTLILYCIEVYVIKDCVGLCMPLKLWNAVVWIKFF